jgi:hypothetical protein
MKCTKCGNLVMDSDDACVRCGVRFVDGPVKTNPLPARMALVFALIGAAVGQQVYKTKNPISRTGIDYTQASWAGMGGVIGGTAGFALGVIAFGRKKYESA